MLRGVRMIAASLAGEFGSPQRVADEMRLVVRRAPLVKARAIYFPPEERRPRPALLLHGNVGADERSALVVKAISHYFLRHHQSRFSYGANLEPLYSAPREQLEVQIFVEEFLARCRPAADVSFRARRPG